MTDAALRLCAAHGLEGLWRRQPGTAARMLTLAELCEWLNITERHARKLVERDAIPYRKVGRLLRFPEAEIED